MSKVSPNDETSPFIGRSACALADEARIARAMAEANTLADLMCVSTAIRDYRASQVTTTVAEYAPGVKNSPFCLSALAVS